MVLEVKCFLDVGAFEVHLLKVSALPCRSGFAQAGLKLSHPSACPVFQNCSLISILRHSLGGGRVWSEERRR